ncbi:MAG: T9SS type A sorting domain-containing protein [Aureispira sp.]|nr:T9SS type A sorting domain-containing protein [Aureispira sp.]
MKNIILSALILIFTTSFGFAQYELERTVIGSAGFAENVAGPKTLGASIGEPLVQGGISGTYELTEGFQQESITITAVENIPEEVSMDVKLYPVPTKGLLNIDFGELNSDELAINVYSVDGQELPLTVNNVSNTVQQLDLSPFNNGMYLIRIVDLNTGNMKTYKVLKANSY